MHLAIVKPCETTICISQLQNVEKDVFIVPAPMHPPASPTQKKDLSSGQDHHFRASLLLQANRLPPLQQHCLCTSCPLQPMRFTLLVPVQ